MCIDDIQQKLVKKLKTAPIPIMGAVLYGSWVKGKETPESDLDLLIVSDRINPRRHKRSKEIAVLKRALFIGFPMDILLLTREECEENFRSHNPLFLDIACEGIILIDDHDFLKSLIQETKEYISTRGIEKLDDGWRFPVLYRKATVL